MHRVNYEDGMTFHGNTGRIQKVLARAKAGEKLTLGYLGGSITQGSLSSTPDTCYAALVTKWWREQFPQTESVPCTRRRHAGSLLPAYRDSRRAASGQSLAWLS